MRPAFALIAPLVLVAACATTGETAPPAAAACPPTRGWSAFVNAMPGPGPGAQPALIVTGEAEVFGGQTVSLSAGPADRMMPPGQRMVLTVEPGPGIPGAPSGWVQVRGEIRPALTRYREILITCQGKQLGRIAGDAVTVAH